MNDYEKMTNLWSRAELPFKPRGRDSKEAISAQIDSDQDFFIGAFEGNNLVGTMILSSDLRRGWMNRLAVDPRFRRLGTAKALIEMAEKTFRKRGLRIFCALIEDSNVVSKELFRECGYVEHDDIKYFSKRESMEV
jgi:ribosomal protein S18 acetylase RimI-like enzyme